MNFRYVLGSLVTGLALMTSGLASAQTFSSTDIAGRWESPVPVYDEANKVYGNYAFALHGQRWEVTFTASGDASGNQKLFGLRIGNSNYSLGKAADSISNAREGDFERDTIFITAYAQPLADMFKSAKCGSGDWTLGQEQEITGNGCAFIPSKAQCPKEFDIVVFDGKTLSFGDRSSNMCALPRPIRASKVVLVRQGQ